MSVKNNLVSGLVLVLLYFGLMGGHANAQEPELPIYDLEDVDVSYIYAALMGTGSYKIGGRRITMLRVPISWTQQKMTDTEPGFKWYMPVVIGNDSVSGSDWYDQLFPENFVTLTFLPGFEYQFPVTPDWVVKPFGHFGVTHDFVTHEVILMGVLGLSSVARYDLTEHWDLRWGNKIRFAVEDQLKSDFQTSFGVFETGFDVRRDTGFSFLRREVDIGAYYRFQHFIPEWDVGQTPDRKSDIENVHEIGFSVGLDKPQELFGVGFSRVRVGYKTGGDVRGFTIGGEFPF
ncbi:MAG: hypothetical protein V7709_17885 [Halioglobus sp.]